MAQLVVRNLEAVVKARLRRRASRHGHSMEAEVRDILRNAVRAEEAVATPLGSRLRKRFAGIGLDQDIAELRGQGSRGCLQAVIFGDGRPRYQCSLGADAARRRSDGCCLAGQAGA